MTNREKFKDELDTILIERLAVKDGKPVACEKSNARNVRIVNTTGVEINLEIGSMPSTRSRA